VASVLAAGGTLTAWASWTTGATTAPITGSGAKLATMASPQAKLTDGTPSISWKTPTAAPSIDGFVVTRKIGTTSAIVCTVPAATTSCLDQTAPSDTTVRYLVHATLAQWAGGKSDPSDPITTPAAAPLAEAVKVLAEAAKVKAPAAKVTPTPTAPEAAAPKPADPPAPAATTAPEPTVAPTTEAATTEPAAPATTAPAEPAAMGSAATTIPG
jgi:hypothetical protein